MMRMPIGGCDFDLEPWAYNELPVNDLTLSNFTQLDPRDIENVNEKNNSHTILFDDHCCVLLEFRLQKLKP